MMRIMLPPDGMVMPHIMYEVVASVLSRNTGCEEEGQTEDRRPEVQPEVVTKSADLQSGFVISWTVAVSW